MNNLFIEGPIQTGKSTIIRRCLSDYKGVLGGFSSQRIREKNTGEVLGFSLMPASDFRVEIYLDVSELAAKENLFLSQRGDYCSTTRNVDSNPVTCNINTNPTICNDNSKPVTCKSNTNPTTCNDDSNSDSPDENNNGNEDGRGSHRRFVFSPEVFAGAGVRFLENYQDCDLMLLDEIGGVELQVESFKNKLYEVLASPVPCIGVLKGIPNAESFKNKKVLAENMLLREFLTGDKNSEIISL